MSNNSLGIGVVGYGYWGPNLVRNFASNPSARVVCVSDLDPQRLADSRRLYPNLTTTCAYEDIIKNPEVDAVVIATPVHTHYELALAALKAGKHVLVEKPLASSADMARRLIDEADRRGLTLMVDHTFLYTPAIQKIRELLLKDELGQIYYYDSTRSSLGLFQRDVNVIWDLAVHDISIIHYILEEEPVAVSATGSCHVAGSPENMAHITLFFDSPCVAHVSVNWLSPIKVRQTFVGGSNKMIVYDDLEPTEKIKVYDKGITLNGTTEDAKEFRIGYRAGDMWAPHISTKEALQTEVEHFIDCACNGTKPISNGISALRVIEVLEAASRSIAQQGRPIVLKAPQQIWKRARATA
ncbi:Gfo/Idh/MocA family protein [Bradyrhizobium sp. CCBAU 25338]|uniref:Gfo/Idh/MocA family protein n=1 Tax=Bradyrhizobium sp. CCBAU 25338 TaxID=1641877 RepID=UPI00230272FD|nr:Gfo/Idh/MocA family oxidoreductase [Bradyrhizobium sp. CCBAU 25338]MDA9526863.1 oxidoreductase [Bradyrhizobium sp. CCBAU 25338]